MSKVVLDVSMSLDGFTAGPNVREAEPMGDGGERLHAWMAGTGPDGQIDIGVRREVDATVGATVIGRRTFDLGLGPWGGTPWPGIPSFVVTHRARQGLLGNNGGMFAFDGLEAAVRRAKQAAEHKDVLVLGADVARQLLRAGLLDEVRIHLVPLLLGVGTPLFDGEQAELIPERKPVTGTVTHLRFRVAKAWGLLHGVGSEPLADRRDVDRGVIAHGELVVSSRNGAVALETVDATLGGMALVVPHPASFRPDDGQRIPSNSTNRGVLSTCLRNNRPVPYHPRFRSSPPSRQQN